MGAVSLGRAGAVVGPPSQHRRGSPLAGGDAGRLGRPVGQRGQRRLVRGGDRRFLLRQQPGKAGPVRGGDGRRQRDVARLRHLHRQGLHRVVNGGLDDGHHAVGRRRAEPGLDDELAGADVPVRHGIGRRPRRRAGEAGCREGQAGGRETEDGNARRLGATGGQGNHDGASTVRGDGGAARCAGAPAASDSPAVGRHSGGRAWGPAWKRAWKRRRRAGRWARSLANGAGLPGSGRNRVRHVLRTSRDLSAKKLGMVGHDVPDEVPDEPDPLGAKEIFRCGEPERARDQRPIGKQTDRLRLAFRDV